MTNGNWWWLVVMNGDKGWLMVIYRHFSSSTTLVNHQKKNEIKARRVKEKQLRILFRGLKASPWFWHGIIPVHHFKPTLRFQSVHLLPITVEERLPVVKYPGLICFTRISMIIHLISYIAIFKLNKVEWMSGQFSICRCGYILSLPTCADSGCVWNGLKWCIPPWAKCNWGFLGILV